MTIIRKKLIEHSLPLAAINRASAREQNLRHGHPSTVHLWWARRPLAACRAVLFAQVVDDPSAWPDLFPATADQERERRRLHRIIEDMVEWPKTDAKSRRCFERAIEGARIEIARCAARSLGHGEPDYGKPLEVLEFIQDHAPRVWDPFCGGGSIPVEAQRLGLEVIATDLNPVAVLLTKALIEFPSKFSGRGPVNPQRGELLSASEFGVGLKADLNYYGKLLRDRVEAAQKAAYPKIDGETQPLAWIWAHTVPSPDPRFAGQHVPLVSSFVLSKRTADPAIVELLVEGSKWEPRVVDGDVTKAELEQAASGTKAGRGQFKCCLSGAPISNKYISQSALAGDMDVRMLAVVIERNGKRRFLAPTEQQIGGAAAVLPEWEPQGKIQKGALGVRVIPYGFSDWSDLFTTRQRAVLTSFVSELAEIREQVLIDARRSLEFDADGAPLHQGGLGAVAYADAIATYLALSISKLSVFLTKQSRWRAGEAKSAPGFGRAAIPMVWDFAEINPFAGGGGDFLQIVRGASAALPNMTIGRASAQLSNAATCEFSRGSVFNTDPPYYDNIGYADLSDYFYVWLRAALAETHPDLFRRVLVPKSEELIIAEHRHESKQLAEAHFVKGMQAALASMGQATDQQVPLAIYYAFKQSEQSDQGLISRGWAAFLQAVVDAGLQIDGTWPIRTENQTRLRSQGSNALAASVVLVCRPRVLTDNAINRRDFLRELRPAMQQAIFDHQRAGVPLPDRRQAGIGPGIGVFSKYAMVRESDDSPMSVATALALVNREIDAILSEGTEDLDAETRFALEWYQQFGYGLQKSKAGDAIQQLQGFNLDVNSINASGIFRAQHGDAKLLSRGEMEDGWTPSKDPTFTLWEMAQHLARALTAEDGGLAKCGQLLAEKPTAAADVLLIAERMFEIATTRNENDEAFVWNQLQTSWPGIETASDEAREQGYAPEPEQAGLL
tara:strand:+ start:2421 stop:5285 length:2865 start_codon:yes stop_codon:yes gene_type:complete